MMPKRPLQLSGIVLAMGASGLVARGQDTRETLRWSVDLETAQKEAVATGRPVLAYFTFDT